MKPEPLSIFSRLSPLFIPGFVLFIVLGCAERRADCPPNSPDSSCRLEFSAYFCDDYAGGRCLEKQDGNVITYSLLIPRARAGSWRDFSNYVYFHSRQTPGLRVDFNRPLSPREKESLRSSLKCSYRLRKNKRMIEIPVKGRRLDAKGGGFWCFDYLGEALHRYHEKYGSLESSPEKSFFPVHLRIVFRSALHKINGERNARIFLNWKEKK